MNIRSVRSYSYFDPGVESRVCSTMSTRTAPLGYSLFRRLLSRERDSMLQTREKIPDLVRVIEQKIRF
ncbi:MAG: hypothetical protein ACE5JC_10605 [Candidatus Zixiibacteriota bacterium]